jgi:hypothetical protein
VYSNSLRNSLNSSLGSSPLLSPTSAPMGCDWPTMTGSIFSDAQMPYPAVAPHSVMQGRGRARGYQPHRGMRGNDAGCVIKLFKMMPKDDKKYSLDVIGTYSGYDGQDAWNKLRSAGPALCPLAPVTTNISVGGWEYTNAGTVKITNGTLNARKPPAPDAGTGPGTGKNRSWGGKGAPPPYNTWAVFKTYRNGEKLTFVRESMRDDGSDHKYELTDGSYVPAEFITPTGKGKAGIYKQPEQQIPRYGLLIAYPGGGQQVNVIFPLNDGFTAYTPRGATTMQFPQTRPLFPPAADCNVSGKFRCVKSGKGNGGSLGNAAARMSVSATSMSRESTPSTTAMREAQGFTILNAALGAAASEALAAVASGLPNTDDLGSIVGGVIQAYDALTGGGTSTEVPTSAAPADASGYADAGGGYADAGGGGGLGTTGMIVGALGAVAALYFITKG